MNETTTKNKTGRREQRKHERRKAIIEVARISFLENGYAATSMSGLLDTLGGSKSTLWSYFRSKEDLFRAVIDDATTEFRDSLISALAPHKGLAESLRVFCRQFMLATESPQAVALWRLIIGEGARFPELGTIFYESAAQIPFNALSTFLSPYIGKELKAGDPKRMAQILISLCTGHQERFLLGVNVNSYEILDEAALEYTTLFLLAYSNL